MSLIRTDFDPRFKFYSPGSCLRYLTLVELFDSSRVHEYDFGGRDYDYKLKWTDRVREHWNIVAPSDSIIGQTAVSVAMWARRRRSVDPASGDA